jgi:hypothetical protein
MSPESTNPGDLYKSLPLPPTSSCIRIYDIDPPNLSLPDGGPIKGNLRVVDLDDQPPFTALSYVWGTYAVNRHIVNCSTHILETTANCHSALWHLRKRLRQFTIWIDSLCIDQTNVVEKVQQIQMMERIYSDAHTVFVWLGNGTAGSDRGMDYMATAGLQDYFFTPEDREALSNEHTPVIRSRPKAAAWSFYLSSFRLSSSPLLHDGPILLFRILIAIHILNRNSGRHQYTSMEDVNDVLQREWIRRMWTFQEILFASNPIMVCGDKHIPWARFIFGITFIECSAFAYEDWDDNTFSWEALEVFRGQINARTSSLVFSLDASSSLLSGSLTSEQYADYRKFFNKALDWRSVIYSVEAVLWVLSLLLVVCFLFIDGSTHWVAFKISSTSAVVLSLIQFRFHDNILTRFGRSKIPRSVTMQRVSDFANICMELCTRKVKEPKDKSFAVHAFLKKLSTHCSTPDYGKPTGQIYRELSTQILEMSSSLQILLAASVSSMPAEPSWVADWNADFNSFWIKPESIFDRRKYRATKNSKSIWKWGASGNLLVRGRRLGTGILRCPTFQKTSSIYLESEAPIHLSNIAAMLKFFDLCHITRPDHYQWEHETWEILDRRVILRGRAPINPTEMHGEIPVAWKETMQTMQERQMSPSEALSVLISPQLLPENLRPQGFNSWLQSLWFSHRSDVLKAQISLCNLLAGSGRTLFGISGNGLTASIGTCSDQVKDSDDLVLVSGVSIPLVMREEGDSYRIITLALVDEELQGGLWAMTGGEEDLEELKLC